MNIVFFRSYTKPLKTQMKPILTLIGVILAGILFAQQKEEGPVKQNSISITTGYYQVKEEILHPKVHSGLTIGTSFQHSEISRIISEYGAGLKVSVMSTLYEDFPSSASVQILGNYKYLFTISGNDKLKYYLGPSADLHFGTNAFFNWDESHLYWGNYVSGGIGNRVSYKLGRTILDFNLDIPFVSAISRPENNRQYKIDKMTVGGIVKALCSNLEGAFPDKHFYLKSGIELKVPRHNKKMRSFGYNFKYHYMKATEGMPYQNIEHLLVYKYIF
jgi:hypothetical protein